MENIQVKTCSKCGVAHPATTEFFRKQARGKFGVTSWCKKCEKAYHAARYADSETGAKIKERNLAWHRARAVGPRPLLTEEEKRARARQRAQRLREREPERQRELRKARLQKPKTRARLRAYRAAHAEQYRGYSRKWAASNPDKVAALARNRRARKRAADGKHTAEDIQRQLKSQNGKCYWCGKVLALSGDDKYHVDHIIALSKGGSNGPENLCCSCPDCNLSKHNKTPWEFAGRLF